MENKQIIVDGKVLTEQEFLELKSDPKIRLKEVSENTYTTLQKLKG